MWVEQNPTKTPPGSTLDIVNIIHVRSELWDITQSGERSTTHFRCCPPRSAAEWQSWREPYTLPRGVKSPHPSCLPCWLHYYRLWQTRTESLSWSQGILKKDGPETSTCPREDRGAESGPHWVGRAWQPGTGRPGQERWWPLSWRRSLRPC